VLGCTFLLGSLAILALPTVATRWAAPRRIGRVALAAMGAPIAVRGLDRIPPRGAVLLFNHSSYMDAFVLGAVLPGEPAIVSGNENASGGTTL